MKLNQIIRGCVGGGGLMSEFHSDKGLNKNCKLYGVESKGCSAR